MRQKVRDAPEPGRADSGGPWARCRASACATDPSTLWHAGRNASPRPPWDERHCLLSLQLLVLEWKITVRRSPVKRGRVQSQTNDPYRIRPEESIQGNSHKVELRGQLSFLDQGLHKSGCVFHWHIGKQGLGRREDIPSALPHEINAFLHCVANIIGRTFR